MLYMCLWSFLFFFFFKQKTAYEMRISDWSSDVCSSDLVAQFDIVADDLAVVRLAEGDADVRERVERTLRRRADHAGDRVQRGDHLVALGRNSARLAYGTSCGPSRAATAAAVTIPRPLGMWVDFMWVPDFRTTPGPNP